MPEIDVILDSRVWLLYIILTWAGYFIVLVSAIISDTGTYYDMIPNVVGVIFLLLM